MATFNGSCFVEAQLRSILPQLNDDDEILISDDGSVDNTLDIITSIQDERIKIVNHNGNLGVVKNFECALSHASGEYIFLCDQDDIWLPNKVDRCLQVLADHLLVVSDCRVVDKNLNELHPSFFGLRKSSEGVVKNLYKNSYLGCCMAFRKELLAYALPVPEHVPMHDMWLGLLANCVGKVKFLPEALMLYRRHDKNASPTAQKSNFSVYQQLIYRIRLSFLLIKRLVLLHSQRKLIKS
ncbi:glycosyltransferase family 2 protein [Methylobacillus arboreus]|uniref:glycosyltransferase family 2 protein n=1 Tax=Methylobacillus arboreus TaxID=755170 RepID=UPI001E585AE3|nr:glycosyltransferase family 2 protein [Methylobacillus arboreus]